MTKKVNFAAKRPSADQAGNLDDWVEDRNSPKPERMKRLTIDLPLGLHSRVKSGCAVENLVIAEVVRDLLDRRFPKTSEQGLPS